MKKLRHARCEVLDSELTIEKQRSNLSAVQKVLEIAIDLKQRVRLGAVSPSRSRRESS
jgi:hypothetical protein